MVKIEEHNQHEHRRATDEKKHTQAKKAGPSKLLRYLVGASAIQVILLVVIAFQLSNLGGVAVAQGNAFAAPTQAVPTPRAPSPSGAAVADMKALADDDPFLGDEDAPVTIVEFSDYECPFCARFYSQTLAQIKSKYIETGKVKFVYRDFPLGFHQQAIPAAIAANCAGEQGKYFEFHDKVFTNGGSGGKSGADYKQWAKEIGVDVAAWEQCLDDPKQAAEIQKDLSDGSAAGISGTPGFIIEGQLVSGAQPFSAFEQIIEAALAS